MFEEACLTSMKITTIFIALSLFGCKNDKDHSSHTKAQAKTTIKAAAPVVAEVEKNVPTASKEKVVAIFAADWCGSCKTLDPIMQATMKQANPQNATFVKFDLTDDASKAKSLEAAKKMGLEEIYAANNSKTGFALVLDKKTKAVLGTINKTYTVESALALIN